MLRSGWLTLPTGGNFASSGRHRKRFTQEQEHLQPLLGTDFDIRHVSWDGYIEVGGNRYSVPESLCGQLVSIRISLDDELRIYSNEQQVASHRLCSAAYGWQTVPEHHAPLWQQASERMAERLGEIQKRVITVCDREADIWHYLYYKVSHGQRGACCTESPAGRGTRQALRTAGSPGNRRKPHAECDAKRRAAARQARMFISYSEVSIKKIPTTAARRSRSRMSVAGSRQRTVPAGIC